MTEARELIETAIAEIIEDRLKEVHTCMPGIVVSFDRTTQTAEVQPCLKRKHFDNDPEELPIITDVPVVFPGTGGLWLVGDVKVDSYVLLFFAERAIDNWQSKGGIVDPARYRLHDKSDAFALAGIWPDPNQLSVAVQANTIAIRNSTNTIKIEVADSGTITIDNSVGECSLNGATGQWLFNDNLEVNV